MLSIFKVYPPYASPVLKSDLIVAGENFGTDYEKLTVTLVSKADASKTYDCKLMSNLQLERNGLTCQLGGGDAGAYRVVVRHSEYGYSRPTPETAADFEYKVEVTSLSPSSGSVAGGTILTIKGVNFSPTISENQVVIGDSKANTCTLLTARANMLTCRVKSALALPNSKAVIDAQQKVYVYTKNSTEVACASDVCKYTYQTEATPTVTSVSKTTVVHGDKFTITGTNFNVDAAETKIFLGDTELDLESVNKISATQLEITMGRAEYGAYPLGVLLDNMGLARFSEAVTITNEIKVDSVTPETGSKYGNVFTIKGSGFNSEVTVRVGKQDCLVSKVTPEQITCEFMAQSNEETKMAVKVEYADASSKAQQKTCAAFLRSAGRVARSNFDGNNL